MDEREQDVSAGEVEAEPLPGAADDEALPGAADDEAGSPRRGKLVGLTFGIAAGVVVLDQITKALAVAFLEGQPPIDLLGGLITLTFLRNPGAAFSIGTGFTFVFAALAIGVAVYIVRKAPTLGSVGWAIALGGLLGGAVGNLIDRLFRAPGFFQGHVVDFITFPNFAVFNVADMAITCSAALMVLLALRGIEPDGRRA